MTLPALRRECPVGCGRGVPKGRLMCLVCWREVPAELQREVNRTWRRYRLIVDNPAREASRGDARAAYQRARDAAVGAIR